MTKMNENTLIRLCLQGKREQSRDAFETLVKKYQSNVMALAMNILGDYDDALDMVQETFVQVYVNLDRFDLQRNFKTWLMSIAVKRCLDQLKKRKSFLNYFLKQSKQLHPGGLWELPNHRNLEDSEIFYPLLKKIKDKERIALVLRMNEGYSAKEIAAVLECSESTARVHLFNAKQRLKKLFQTAGEVIK
jgi:RNA polymerase sigma factor (sigma-70 family)